ncbi:hypothetical protein F5X96DRAFT_451681 [Biscogniauxia mediterranea]|nr:hypothetical protein F5X96DRAFT_451681 [Biscogniauxia mediterranea]
MSKRAQRSVTSSHELAKDENEDWSVWSGAEKAQRRKMQNRLNQRASRQRRALERQREHKECRKPPNKSTSRPLLPKPADDHLVRNPDADESKTSSHADTRRQLFNTCSTICRSIDTVRTLSPVLGDSGSRRMFFLSCVTFWPMLDQAIMSPSQPLGSSMFRASIEEPLVLDGHIGAWSLLRNCYSNSPDDMRTGCVSQLRTTRAIRKLLSQGVITDSLLFGIKTLGFQPRTPEHYSGPVRGLYTSIGTEHIGALSILGYFEYGTGHYDVFLQLLRLRGGLRTVTSPGYAEMMITTELVHATAVYRPPNFELPYSYQFILDEELPVIRGPLEDVSDFAVDDNFKIILLDLQLCCRLMNQYAQRLDAGEKSPSVEMIASYRDIFQYRFLSLPRDTPGTRVCQSAVMVFILGVTFPFPVHQPIAAAVQALQSALENPLFTSNQTSEFLFWATMVGAIAAVTDQPDDPTANWYLSEVGRLSKELRLESWDAAKDILHHYVWLDRACDPGAIMIWNTSRAENN